MGLYVKINDNKLKMNSSLFNKYIVCVILIKNTPHTVSSISPLDSFTFRISV